MPVSEEPWWVARLQAAGLDELVRHQEGIVGRDQLLLAKVPVTAIRRHLRRREWTVVWPGVYATRPGKPTPYGKAIGALLYAGPTGTWSHATAAHQLGLRTEPPLHLDVSIDRARRVVAQPGLRVHRVIDLASRRLASVSPPRVTAAHAVIDQVAEQRALDDVVAVVAGSCQTGRVRLEEIMAASQSRPHRWGTPLRTMADALDGSDSVLEVRFVRDVEGRHRLPKSTRQRRAGQDISDCAYDDFGVLVELDGRLHLVPARRWRDMAKDNRSALRGELTLRYGWIDVYQAPCTVAAQVLGVLQLRGFRGETRPCRAGCPLAVSSRLPTSRGEQAPHWPR